MIVGLGHRCGTGFAASLLKEHGLDVRHEDVGADGVISWMQVAKRRAGPWGNTLPGYPDDAKLFLVARSPLAALNSVATENQQIRSIGFRSQLTGERRNVDLFVWDNQTAGEGVYDFFGWAVMSLVTGTTSAWRTSPTGRTRRGLRIEEAGDDAVLGDFLGRTIVRQQVWQNRYGPQVMKKSGRLEYSMDELRRVPKVHLAKLISVTAQLGCTPRTPGFCAAISELVPGPYR